MVAVRATCGAGTPPCFRTDTYICGGVLGASKRQVVIPADFRLTDRPGATAAPHESGPGLAALAGAEENAAVVAGRRLGHLHVEAIAVERDFAGDGDAGLGGAEIVAVARQAERSAEQPEPAAGLGVERALGLPVIGDGLLEVERLGFPGHGGNSESG